MNFTDIRERLYYNITPNPATSIFLLFSSQLLGYEIHLLFLADANKICRYGIGGMMRSKSTLTFVVEIGVHMFLSDVLLYPSKMLYPLVLPLMSMFDALYEGGIAAQKKLRVFYTVFSM